jgi:hypothetical protein
VFEFRQSTFLAKFIAHCTLLRRLSNSEFRKRLWKLLANSNFGKMIERTRDFLDCKFVTNKESCKKWIQSPRYSNTKIISDEFVVIFLKRSHVTLNKPLQIGFAILENAKYIIFDDYYNDIKPNLIGECGFATCELLMSDTDCVLAAVNTVQRCDNLKKLSHIMDFSNYPKTDKRFTLERQNVLGYYKDELAGEKMEAFCGLRSKTYVFTVKKNSRKKKHGEKRQNVSTLHSKCKGVTKSYRKKITFQNYKSCVQSFSKFNIDQFTIRSKNHKLQTLKTNKLCFSSFDDKRYLMQCGVHSVPYGSVLIEQSKDMCVLCKTFNPMKKRFSESSQYQQ